MDASSSSVRDVIAEAWPPRQPSERHGCLPPAVDAYPTISSVSAAFTLNYRQHITYCLITTALLRRFEQQERAATDESADYRTPAYTDRLRDDQLLMFLGGAGGTGKSRVIDAVDSFCSGWRRSKSMIKTALNGKKQFAPLDLLVVDEISMMNKTEWLKLDHLLRRYMHVECVPFGGVHIVLVGDFLQMPPVRADPIYLDPTSKPRPSTADLQGFELWRQVTTIVVLDESDRFRDDLEWGEGSRNARLGHWTPEFMAMINARVCNHEPHEGDPLAALTDSACVSSAFVTSENATRLAINNAFMKATASVLPRGVYPTRVVANFKGALNALSESDLRYVLSLPDNRFGRMTRYLDLVDGMPIQVTQNVTTAKGIANGTLGRLEYVHFPADTEFRLARDAATSMIVRLPSRAPEYAVIRVPGPQTVAVRPGGDPELFHVFFNTKAYKKTTIWLAPAPDGQPRSVTVRPQQFSFVCAVGSTVYKVQGETLRSMVVVDWKSSMAVINKPQDLSTCLEGYNTQWTTSSTTHDSEAGSVVQATGARDTGRRAAKWPQRCHVGGFPPASDRQRGRPRPQSKHPSEIQ